METTALSFWLGSGLVWAHSLVYSSSRVVVNLSQVQGVYNPPCMAAAHRRCVVCCGVLCCAVLW